VSDVGDLAYEEIKQGRLMPFQNREEAAHLLAQRLTRYRRFNPLVLAIPRGAVAMAKIIADALGGELDVVLVHKLGAPGQPELAIGAVDEQGQVYLSDHAEALDISPEYLAAETEAQLKVLRARRAAYTPLRAPADPAGRVVIVVDNGVATGATLIAGLRAVRARGPARLVAAVAVAPRETFRKIAREADETVCLEVPAIFFAVGEFFKDFSQVTDEEVAAVLRQSGPRSGLGK
jgi:putative phosphoribosyl transferase